ncbi:MAG: FHA domain-containing protein [Thermoanaerobaculia bacterium]
MRFRFGECVLDSGTRELTRGESVVHVSPKAFQFLELLLAERPRAIAKDEIHERLWPGTFVSDGTLTSLAAELRSAIGDDAHEPRFVRTVHRFGYAFSGEARQESAAPPRGSARFAWRLFWGSREIALEEGECILGRDPAATVLVDHKSVSRQHARIRVAPEGATLEDLGSKNGTSLQGERLQGPAPAPLSDGGEIRIGSVPMTFRVFTLPDSTETASKSAPSRPGRGMG